ncbi:MAG: hypothetical protein GQ572_02090 [Gammaproteobacteria bacterium]|nr:hypothetical protein [Gammaproteobacteria bacterium]
MAVSLPDFYRPRFFRFSPCRFDRENMMNSYFAQLRCFTWIFSITMIYSSNTIAADDHWQHEVALYLVGASID